MKYIANIITATRIILSVVLLFLSPMSALFFIIYTTCGFTDMIDGSVARHLGSEGRFGALLDSIADITFVAASAIRLLPSLYPLLPKWWIYPVIVIVSVRFASIIAGLIRFRRLCFLHTYFNKIVGVIVFLLPFFYRVQWFSIAVGIVCTFTFVAAADEFVCVLKMKKYNPEIKGLLKTDFLY